MKKYFDGAFVPGREGQKLMSFLGMERKNIYIGSYGAYEEIFNDSLCITKRDNEFLYVGQLNKRKSIDVLIEAFDLYRKNGGTFPSQD